MNDRYDLIIIGSGPAGLTAAIYAERAKLETITIEKNVMSGGQVLNTYEVDNYPGLPSINGFDMGVKFREHAQGLGAKFVEDTVISLEIQGDVKKVVCEGGVYEARTLLLATGAQQRKLDVKGEAEFSGKGVSYCATCDGAFFSKKIVAVVGGGDVAIEDAIFLSRLCKKVFLIHRRHELRGAKSLQEKLFSLENIEFLWDTVVDEIEGNQGVTGVKLTNIKTNEKSALEVQGIFIAIGILPNSEAFIGAVETDKHNYIKAGEEGITSVPGVYAAGDVRTKALRQIVTAVSDGANAITSVERYLAENV